MTEAANALKANEGRPRAQKLGSFRDLGGPHSLTRLLSPETPLSEYRLSLLELIADRDTMEQFIEAIFWAERRSA